MLAVGLLLTYPFWLAALGGYLVSSESPVLADIIVVLAGRLHRESHSHGRRKWCGRALPARRSISGPAGIYGLYEMRPGHPDGGPPRLPGLLFRAAFLTIPNPPRPKQKRSFSELRRLHVHKIDLVTSNFHTRRAGRIFRATGARYRESTWWPRRTNTSLPTAGGKSGRAARLFSSSGRRPSRRWIGM